MGLLLMVTAAFMTAVVLFSVLAKRRYQPTIEEVAMLIENRVKFGTSREWDYFRLVTIPDKSLNAIRERCLELDFASGEERERDLLQVLTVLRGATRR